MDQERDEFKSQSEEEARREGPPPQPFPDHLEIVYGILFQPVQTLRRLVDRPPLGLAFFVFTITALISYVASLQGMSADAVDIPFGELISGTADAQRLTRWMAGVQARLGVKLFPFQLMIAILWWLISTSLMHLAAEFAGGRGQARGLLALLGIVQMPLILLAPATLLGRLIWTGLTDLAGFALSLWVLVLSVLAVRENYGLGSGRAVGVYLLPLIGFLAFLVVTVLAAVLAFASIIPR